MDKKLFRDAIVKFLTGLLLVGTLLFVPAGSFSFWQAWLLLGVLFVPMFAAGLVMLRKCPELLRKRLNMREEQAEQKQVIELSGLMFLAAFIVFQSGVNRFFCEDGAVDLVGGESVQRLRNRALIFPAHLPDGDTAGEAPGVGVGNIKVVF